MRLLFVHDTKIKEDINGDYYTGGSYSKDVWDRYLRISTNFSVLARKELNIYGKEFATNKFNYFDRNKIDFVEVPSISSSLNSFLNIRTRILRNSIIKEQVLRNDAIIARLPSNNGNIAIKYAKKYKKPYLIEVVGCSWDAHWNYGIAGKVLSLYSFLEQKKAIRHSPYVIYVTNKFLQRRYPTRGKNINCSNVVLTEIDINVLQNRLKKIKKMKQNSLITIGTIGALDVKYKGQETVIKALAKLKNENITHFRYQLVGGGNRTYLESIAKKYGVFEYVEFLGSFPHHKVFDWLDNIDVYIQPSKTEGLPRGLIEAMSRGLTSIGTSVGGIPELLDENFIIWSLRDKEREISRLLKGINNQILNQQAQMNFNHSKKYQKKIIESRRNDFLKKFRKSIIFQ
jgi:glycosyltransferase involved in cell wall biosynthesis